MKSLKKLLLVGVLTTVLPTFGMREEKLIVVVIPSYNNSEWYKKNLDSVVSQNYQNYQVIYTDDRSPDGTGDLVEAYIAEKHLEDRITLIKNSTRRGALANLYTMIHSCADDAIIITIDGDDWLKHQDVFQRVNKEYVEHDAWMTYGHYEPYPGDFEPLKKLPDVVVARSIYREFDWRTTHLRTFYAGLFKKITLQDFLDQDGKFLDVTWDMAFMFPMLEMSGKHAVAIPDVLYVYNCATPLNDFKTKLVRQWHYDKVIRSRAKYDRLMTLPWQNTLLDNNVDVCLFSFSGLDNLAVQLNACRQHCLGDIRITVLYRPLDSIEESVYERLQQKYEGVTFIKVPVGTFKESLMALLDGSEAPYIFCMGDQSSLHKNVDLDYAVNALQKTHAYGLYYTLGHDNTKSPYLVRPQSKPASVWLEDDLYAWQFILGEHEWRSPHSLDLALYNKSLLASYVKDLAFDDVITLESALARVNFDLYQVGLFFAESAGSKN